MGEYINHQMLKKDKLLRRSYQEKIFASIIGKNSMVVLPTAMGKTIIALLLSIYHLSDDIDNKIIFLAPTKPLIVQHQKSFKEMIAFGNEEYMFPVLTGSVQPEKRKKIFLDAKIAFMTPQVLQNDIISNRISLSEVSLIIFDEAHRAVGDYAYTFIAEVYLQRNPKGQILAMSASPGGNKEKIETVCKNLKIEHIEIRSDESSDVRPYIQDVQIKWIKLEMPDEYTQPKKNLENLLKIFFKKLAKENFLDSYDIRKVSRKTLLSSSRKIDIEIKRFINDENDEVSKYFTLKKIVSNAIRVSHMLELLEAQGVEPLHDFFQKITVEVRNPKSSKSLKELLVMDDIRTAMSSIRSLIESKFIHPKLIKLGEILSGQFKKNHDSRVLLFANYRDTIKSILSFAENFPMIRAERFIGQANKKSGGKVMKGMTQKEQIATLEKFKNGEFNVLVATSVAEEGLDIAECDLVIFYDVLPSEIRTIQRRGRTGRNRSGEIIILMTKGTREETYYWVAKRREKEMKRSLKSLQKVGLNTVQSKNSKDIDVEKQASPVNSGKYKKGILDYMKPTNEKEKPENKTNEKSPVPSSDPKIPVDETERFISSEEFGGKSKGYTVIVDNRETQSSVVRHLALKGIDLVLKNLPVADYILSENVGIERKSVATDDFSKSIFDGRMFDELHRLRQNFTVPILLIEGNPLNITGISKEAILGALASIIINMKITVLYTTDAAETADIIYAFTKKIQDQKESKGKIFKKKTSSVADTQEQIIGNIPGVNLVRAQELLSAHSNVKNIFNADEDDLKKITGIGIKIAKKIKEIAESDYNKK